MMGPRELALAAEFIVDDLRARGRRVCLEYGGARTAYHSDEAASADWIRRFLGGYFVPCGQEAAQVDVYSTADAGLFAELRRGTSGQPGLERRAFADMPLTDEVVLIHTKATKVTPEEDVFHLLFTRTRRILMVTSDHPEVRREEAMQMLRSVTKWLLIEQGWVPMHSACVAKDGRAICITGQKASGKTSTLLNLLARNGCNLLAIDKFLLRESDSHLEVRGLPGKVGIRIGSAIIHPQLQDWLGQEDDPFFPHISAEAVQQIAVASTPEELRTGPEKIHLLPVELAELFGTSITPSARLALLLIPVFDLRLENARLVPATDEQAHRMLLECYAGLHSKGEGFLQHLFQLSDAVLQERLATLLTKRLPEVGGYELHQNHRTNEQAAKLVGAVLD